jgi:hypothetical protein
MAHIRLRGCVDPARCRMQEACAERRVAKKFPRHAFAAQAWFIGD